MSRPRPADRRYRHMNGYGSHTYSLWNDAGERYWVKFHFKTQQGHQALHQRARPRTSIGDDPRDLPGRPVRRASSAATSRSGRCRCRSCPRPTPSKTPLQPVRPDQGLAARRLSRRSRSACCELNRNPDNYFAEIEQAAFSPSNIVPGIGFSPDKMLQARIFSYADAHRYRLGTHYENDSRQPAAQGRSITITTMARCTSMAASRPAIRTPIYEPNSFGGPVEDKSAKEPPLKISGDADRYNHRDGNDDYSQPRALFNLFDAGQKAASVLQHRGGDGRHPARDRGAPALRISTRCIRTTAMACAPRLPWRTAAPARRFR